VIGEEIPKGCTPVKLQDDRSSFRTQVTYPTNWEETKEKEGCNGKNKTKDLAGEPGL